MSNIIVKITINPPNQHTLQKVGIRSADNFTHDEFYKSHTKYNNMYLNTVASAYILGLGLHLHVEDFLFMIMDIINLHDVNYRTHELFQSMEAMFASSTELTTQLSRHKILSKACTCEVFNEKISGYPTSIYLHGTEKDWPHLEYKLINIQRYFSDNIDLSKQLLELLPIIRKISDSYRGVVDVEFWNNMLVDDGWFYKFIPSVNGVSCNGISIKNDILVGAFGIFQYSDGSIQTIRGYI